MNYSEFDDKVKLIEIWLKRKIIKYSYLLSYVNYNLP